jgi:hypothetical protein
MVVLPVRRGSPMALKVVFRLGGLVGVVVPLFRRAAPKAHWHMPLWLKPVGFS